MNSTLPVSDHAAAGPPAALEAFGAVAPERHRWFQAEVQAHERALRRYLRGSFPAVRDVDDVVQESFLRIWRASLARPIDSAKTFLFQIARNLVVDGFRRTRVARTESLGDLASLNVLDDRPDAAEALTYGEKVEILAEAMASLPARCREIMILRKFQRVPQAEIAMRLGLSERTVESQVTRGMKLVESRVRERGLNGFLIDER